MNPARTAVSHCIIAQIAGEVNTVAGFFGGDGEVGGEELDTAQQYLFLQPLPIPLSLHGCAPMDIQWSEYAASVDFIHNKCTYVNDDFSV